MLHHILDLCHHNFFLVAPTCMALLVKFLDSQVKKPFQKYIHLPPPPPPLQFIVHNVGPNVQNVLGHRNSDILKMYL